MRLHTHRLEIICCPDLALEEESCQTYGRYGMLRKHFLKEHHNGIYASLLLSGKLCRYLKETDDLTRVYVSRLVSEITEKQGIDETLKVHNQMAWVGAMNTIKAQAEEIALAKYVYC